MTIRVNPLPWIALFINEYHDNWDVSRKDLEAWVVEYPNAPKHPALIRLIVDCLIAAGIGNEAEQTQTVYCVAQNGD
jgi:hypothetical protein